jgi:hypothetical protein
VEQLVFATQVSKFLRFCLSLVLLSLATLLPTSAWSDTPNPTLVIIDTGIDSRLDIFQGKLIYEVCVMDWYLCPNGKTFQEGAGSATLLSSVANLNGFDHGTQMASIAVSQNPNVKFIFIRIVANNTYGNRLSVTNENVARALEWVRSNREKFNIRAVAMSQGHHQLLSGAKYCPVVTGVQTAVTKLKREGVAIFFPVGNQGDKKRIDWPACIADSIAMGAINDKSEIPQYSNMDFSLTDLYAPGSAAAVIPGGKSISASGTSVSVQIAAAQWMQFVTLHPEANYFQIFQVFRNSGPLVFDAEYRFGRKLDLSAALAKYEAIATSGSAASAS